MSLSGRLSEKQVVDAFHIFLKNALAQAKAERLLDDDTLSSAEADIMISGPALCLYFAAIRSNTSPPGVPLPRDASSEPMMLTSNTCPPAFTNVFALWASSVAPIKSLSADQKHDLARAICDLPLVSSRPHPATGRIAADLRAVAIEISQRRTFQDRYGSDLQAVLDSDRRPAGGIGNRRPSTQAQFVPPPAYDAPPSSAPIATSPKPQGQNKPLPAATDSTGHLLPTSPTSAGFPTASGSHPHRPRDPTHSRSASASGSSSGSRSRSPSPSILVDTDPVIMLIRETLYASLADVLALTPSLRSLMKTDPARAYFASVSLAVLDVATKAVTPEGDVKGVLGQYVTFEECPDLLKPAMRGLDAIARRARELSEEDDQAAMELLAEGKDEELAGRVTRMERLKKMLEAGAGSEEANHRRAGGAGGEAAEEEEGNRGRVSPNGTTLELANRINALAMGLTGLAAFRERQNDVFTILGGVQ
ncbi:hypothetical protein DL93DRAFT_1148519 [Clavulina sp. PMI_390]|nr:hypothetical protein DL93DRAFT_1148519 [Clavulina sp. PMI_390]